MLFLYHFNDNVKFKERIGWEYSYTHSHNVVQKSCIDRKIEKFCGNNKINIIFSEKIYMLFKINKMLVFNTLNGFYFHYINLKKNI